MNFTVGCDPELFLKLGDKYISADGLFPGTKEEPYKVEGGAIQVDGLALEFNIDPASSFEEFDRNIVTVMAQMKEMTRKIDKDMKLDFTPHAAFDRDYFDTLPDHSKVLGCDPDFEYNGAIKEPPEIGDIPERTAAGHVHIGWTEDEDSMSAHHFADCKLIATRFYGLYSSTPPFYYKTKEEDKRLLHYGNEGAFRPKPYGIELRSPSNLWVNHKTKRQSMYNLVINTMNQIASEAARKGI